MDLGPRRVAIFIYCREHPKLLFLFFGSAAIAYERQAKWE